MARAKKIETKPKSKAKKKKKKKEREFPIASVQNDKLCTVAVVLGCFRTYMCFPSVFPLLFFSFLLFLFLSLFLFLFFPAVAKCHHHQLLPTLRREKGKKSSLSAVTYVTNFSLLLLLLSMLLERLDMTELINL